MRLFTALILLLGCITSQQSFSQNSYPVRFSWGTEFFPDNYQAILENPDIHTDELVNGYYIRFIQCTQIPTARERAGLEAVGVQFISYLQFGAYLVALPRFFDLKALNALHVRSVVPVKPEWKMARTLKEEPYGDWAVHGNMVDIDIQLYPQVRIAEGADWLRQAGYIVLEEGNQNGFLRLRVAKDKIADVAALPQIRYLELLPPPGAPEDTGGRALHRVGLVDSEYASGLHYDGEGVTTLVRDDGPIGPHVDFKGRLDNLDTKSQPGDINHGDWVGGCIGAAGNIDPAARGFAAGAKIFAIPYKADFQDATMPLHFSKNVTITNSSYSNGCNAGYTLASQTVDQQLFDNPTLIHVFSGGNSNGSNCGYGAGNQWGNITGGHKMSKNSIAVANINAIGELHNTSSRGPAYDGRLKPEISAHGTDVFMTQPDNTYSINLGTSFSAPHVAGGFAQLTQAYKELHNGDQPETGLLKAALMNTANDLGNAGPDFKFGFGYMNVYRALNLLQKNNHVKGSVDQNGESIHNLQVLNGTRQLRVMVYWLDPPASENAGRALINDLDLTVVSPDSSINLPWTLNPTPTATALDTPAGKGRDSLNNFEQVVIDMPAAGSYQLKVKGFEVPMGPQAYTIVWEMLNDDIKLTYPAGGEGFTAGEKVRIQWDAYGTASNFTLRYSPNNGITWNPLITLSGEKREFDWTLPNIENGEMRLLIIRGSKRDTTDFPFSIAPVPENLKVEKVCPDSMTVSWTAAYDTLNSDVFLLGSKYMEIVGTTDTNFLTFPIQNAGADQWISVRASHPNGLAGRRAVAINWPGELLNCPQQFDIGVRKILAPNGDQVIGCGPTNKSVTVRLLNEGSDPISGATINYQLNGDPPVSESLPDIPAAGSLEYTFQTDLTVSQNGTANLKIWSSFGPDVALFNDTLFSTFSATTVPATAFFGEDFESSQFPSYGWSVHNPDDDITWKRTSIPVTGADGQPTYAAVMECTNYQDQGQKDYLYLVPIDLDSLPNPGITFDLAHANYDANYSDLLRVEVFADCDLNATPVVLWSKSGPALATTGATTAFFTPDSPADWRKEFVSLKNFAGKSIVLRFTCVNDWGNNIYLDNINLTEFQLPTASIIPSTNSLCQLDTIEWSAVLNNIPNVTYSWLFGSNAQPGTATGPGPHKVRYLTAGSKNVRLITANTFGADTAKLTYSVQGLPAPNFTYAINNLIVTFTNTSQNGQSYFWDFGDGDTSTEPDPVHTYAAPGDYSVMLTTTGPCGTATKTQKFTLTFVGTKELSEFSSIRILPNPTTGDFRVELSTSTGTDLRLTLLDMQGRLVKTIDTNILPGTTTLPFEELALPAGTYQLNLQTESGAQVFSVVVQ